MGDALGPGVVVPAGPGAAVSLGARVPSAGSARSSSPESGALLVPGEGSPSVEATDWPSLEATVWGPEKGRASLSSWVTAVPSLPSAGLRSASRLSPFSSWPVPGTGSGAVAGGAALAVLRGHLCAQQGGDLSISPVRPVEEECRQDDGPQDSGQQNLCHSCPLKTLDRDLGCILVCSR
ncbi:hypothetical protein GCM10018966_099060 [Streptomyces yanii]